jgi:hypothetical protein
MAIALPRLLGDGFVADAAFVDGSHIFHNLFVDLFFLRELVRPGGLVILDDCNYLSVATAVRYFEVNTGWEPEPGRRGCVPTGCQSSGPSQASRASGLLAWTRRDEAPRKLGKPQQAAAHHRQPCALDLVLAFGFRVRRLERLRHGHRPGPADLAVPVPGRRAEIGQAGERGRTRRAAPPPAPRPTAVS